MTPSHHQLKFDPTQVTARPHAIRDIEWIDIVFLQLLHLDWVVGLEGGREGGRQAGRGGGRGEKYECVHAIRDVERIDVAFLQLVHLDWIVGLEGGREG